MGAVLLSLVILAAMVWNYNYGYSLKQWKHILSGEYVYDAGLGVFTYFGEVYFPRDFLEAKFLDAGTICYLLAERGEPVLYQYRAAENETVFRFCAYGYYGHGSNNGERVYRIHINEAEKSGYVIYEGDTRIDLDAQQCDAILAIFSDEHFWDQPFSDILKTHSLTIIMEGKRGEQYHMIKRYPPDDESTIDEALDELFYHTGLSEFESIIGGIPKQGE